MTRKGPAAEENAAEKPARERILAVASDLFYRQGIRSVGVDEVVAAAGVAKMSLYRSFPSKDELAAAYLEAVDERYWRWWDEIAARHPQAPREQLRELFLSLAKRTTRADWRGCPFTNAATEFPEIGHPARAVAEANKHELRRRLVDLCRAIEAQEPAALADQLVLLFEGAYTSAQTFGADGPACAVAAAAEALIEAQLSRKSGAPARSPRAASR
ncbi:MAG TPA: TetR/AcrR family transcriptional regulator [Stellaceae bacterium]|nr:TetR/AcrR family transcriptional regulator [Stellaceae bacterium]